MIVVNERDAYAARLAADSNSLSDVFKLAIAFVVQQAHAIAEADGEVRMAVIIEIACCAAEAAAL